MHEDVVSADAFTSHGAHASAVIERGGGPRNRCSHLDQGNDETTGGLVQCFVIPVGVGGVQPVAPPVVLPHKQVMEDLQGQVLVGPHICNRDARKGQWAVSVNTCLRVLPSNADNKNLNTCRLANSCPHSTPGR